MEIDYILFSFVAYIILLCCIVPTYCTISLVLDQWFGISRKVDLPLDLPHSLLPSWLVSSYVFSLLIFLRSYRHRIMPARTPSKFCCFCVLCLASCATGPDGNPLGNLIPESQRVPHLAHAKAETEAQRLSQESDLQKAAASLFASTLVDDGPNLHTQPSRLWTSREGYQSSASRTVPDSEGPRINTIIESFQRLQCKVQDSTPVQSVSQSCFPSDFEALPFDTIIEDLQHLELGDQRSMPAQPNVDTTEASTSMRSTQRLSKRERRHDTMSAHRILDSVEKQTSNWLLELANVVSTADSLVDAESDVGRIQAVFDRVTRDVSTIKDRKTTIGLKLSQLQSRLVELRRSHPHADDKPLQFNSGVYSLCIEVDIELKTMSRSALQYVG